MTAKNTNDSKNTGNGKPPSTPTAPPKKDGSPTVESLTAAYVKRKENYDRQHEAMTKRLESSKANIERIQSQVTKTELALTQLDSPSVREDLVNPLAAALMKFLPGFESYEIVGPVGLEQSITVSFFEKGATEEEKVTGKKARSITLVTKAKDGGIGVRDYSKDTKQYTPGSIGYASGLNHPSVLMPADATVKWLVDWVK